MSLPFDLPLAPLLAGYDLGLPNVPVTLYLFNDKHFKAELQGLNTPQQKIIFINHKGNVVQMGYEQIRYLVFDHNLSEPRYPHPLASYPASVEMPAGFANFHVEFSDGKTISGHTRTFLISDGVLHLFCEDDNDKIKRMFIPLTGVRRYVMGQKLGQVLLHDKVIDQNILDTALEQQSQYENADLVKDDSHTEDDFDIPDNSPAMDFILHADLDDEQSKVPHEASYEKDQPATIPTIHHVVENDAKGGITRVITETTGEIQQNKTVNERVSVKEPVETHVARPEQITNHKKNEQPETARNVVQRKMAETEKSVTENIKAATIKITEPARAPNPSQVIPGKKDREVKDIPVKKEPVKHVAQPENSQNNTSRVKQAAAHKIISPKKPQPKKSVPGEINDMEHLRHEITGYSLSGNNLSSASGFELADNKKDKFEEVWNSHTHSKGKRLGEILKDMGLLNDEDIYHALAEKLSLPFVRLRKFDFDKKSLTYLPVDMVRDLEVIPLLFEDNRLIIAMSDPTNTEAIDTIRFVSGHNIEIAVATFADIEWAIDQYYGSFQDEDVYEDTDGKESANDDELTAREVQELGQERPIVRLVHNIFVDAIRRKASDIHIRPEKKSVDLIYRIDGTLIKIRSFNPSLLPGIVSRIKIMGRMDISERRLPQDGRAQYATVGSKVDLRISVMPTVNGESVVIRILNVDVGLKTIKDLGLSDSDYIAFNDLLHKSNGILLVTGPTGSGKSTTLYAALQEIQKQNVNIITIEDPVEYHIEHILQIQINPSIEYTFARALRNILRHDPDVIMVGEIRDEETAKIAVESALTGHLVLSTLHTNDATGTISRLLEMEIEPYLLNSSVLGVVAQRLVRKNCPYCLEEEYVEPHVRQILGVAEDEVFYHGVGCEECNNTGFSGRMGVYELLVITDNVRQYIKKGVTADELRKVAMQDGMISLTQNALSAAKQRKTSLAEVYRIRLE